MAKNQFGEDLEKFREDLSKFGKGFSQIAKDLVSQKVDQELEKGKHIALSEIDKSLYRSIGDIALNVAILITAIFGSRYFFDKATTTIVITGIYMASACYGALRVLWNFGEIFRFLFIFLKYRHKAPQQWIAKKITPEIDKAYDEMHFMEKMFVAFGMVPTRAEYVEMQAQVILKAVATRILLSIIIFFIYIGVFRFTVAPILIEEETGLGLIQAFIWPFAYSFDSFFGTHLGEYVFKKDYGGMILELWNFAISSSSESK